MNEDGLSSDDYDEKADQVLAIEDTQVVPIQRASQLQVEKSARYSG